MTPSITQYFAIKKKQINDHNDAAASTNGLIKRRNNEVSVGLSFPVIVIDDDDDDDDDHENENENDDCCEIINSTHSNEICKEEKDDVLVDNKSIDHYNPNFDYNRKKSLLPCTETYVNEIDDNNSNEIIFTDTSSNNKNHTPTVGNSDENDIVEQNHNQSPLSLPTSNSQSTLLLNPFAKFAFSGTSNCSSSIKSKCVNTDSNIPTVQQSSYVISTTTTTESTSSPLVQLHTNEDGNQPSRTTLSSSSKSCSSHFFASKVSSLSTQQQQQQQPPPLPITAVETMTRRNDQQTAVIAQSSRKRQSFINNDQSLTMSQQQQRQKQQKQKQCNDFIPIQQLSESDRMKEVLKWHSLISNDNTITNNHYTIEDRRFQLFVAVRLHARCQETTVRKVMNGLYDRLKQQQEQQGTQQEGKELSFNVQTFAKLDPIVLSTWICNLQFYNTKAKQIIQSSNEIIVKYNSIVPHTEKDLLQLIGIGPVFADLLSYVNTYDIHYQMMKKL